MLVFLQQFINKLLFCYTLLTLSFCLNTARVGIQGPSWSSCCCCFIALVFLVCVSLSVWLLLGLASVEYKFQHIETMIYCNLQTWIGGNYVLSTLQTIQALITNAKDNQFVFVWLSICFLFHLLKNMTVSLLFYLLTEK